jgi:DNA replication licensing factor MCM2
VKVRDSYRLLCSALMAFSANAESLEVSYVHLSDSKPVLAYFLANSPTAMLEIFDQVSLKAILVYYPNYERIHAEIHVRISDLPIGTTLRDLRRSHLNSLVRVSGVVTRRTGVFPQLKYVRFDCRKCGAVLGPFYQDSTKEVRISYCPQCESKGPFSVNSEQVRTSSRQSGGNRVLTGPQTVYRNYQKMTLQESPGSVPAGRLPRHREVVLLWDLIDSAKPGEEIVRYLILISRCELTMY